METSESLIYFGSGMLLVVLVIIAAALAIRQTGINDKERNEKVEFETRKIRFAAVTFTGILVLILFTSILAFANNDGRGFDIFEKVLTSLSPIAGGIIGYLFSAKDKN